SVGSEEQWQALRAVLGDPDWCRAAELQSQAGRRAAHDALDVRLRSWAAQQDREKLVEQLLAAGIPAAPVADPRAGRHNPQMAARGFFEAIEHPAMGPLEVPAVPFRYASVERWLQLPAPTLGQHNREVLGELLGLDAAELDRLEAQGVIGDELVGV
ncbi:MAG: CoA transferase, partial [Deltaproteobacteria bacterium]|nr:CoA transferase [Deltaproteobacteria bacterium]